MADIIAFHSEPADIPDVDSMDSSQLRAYLQELRDQIAQLDAREPRRMNSEEHEAWGDAHEALEDLVDDVLDRLEELE